MSRGNKIFNIIFGILIIFLAAFTLIFPEAGYDSMLFAIEIVLLVYGGKLIIFYLTLARYKVGGVAIFYKGVLYFNTGLFLVFLEDLPKIYAMPYLVIMLLISGVKDVLKSSSSRKLELNRWLFQMLLGAVKIIICLLCLFYMKSPRIMSLLLSWGVLHEGFERISRGFRKNKLMHIN
ncbi:MAG: hypothetical protein K5931_03730 [Lachnospiraceae bacterium]|nr:hypothetical protein [Lachnospiraceae bacterium]